MKRLQTALFTTLLAILFLSGCQNSSNAVMSPDPVKKHDNPSLNWIDDTFSEQTVWQYMAKEMTMPTESNSRIEKEIDFYKNKQRYFTDVSTRAEPYMYWLSEQIKERKMPMELVLIPIIESAFRTDVVSSQNAAGIWQIVPSTGKNFGLKQNQLYDGRHDVVASTTAALDLLERLHKMFDNDWLLAIAAYNSGEGRVMQAIAKNKKQGKPTDFWSLSTLPPTTKQYIPRLLALQSIFKNPEKYGVKLAKADKANALIPVKIDQPIELSAAADQIGISANRLQHLNAGYKKGVTNANGEHYILLPRALETQFISSIESGQIARAKVKSSTDQPNTQTASNSKNKTPNTQGQYTIEKGDSLSLIASKNNVKISDLKKWNNLTDKSLILPGQKLIVNSTKLANAQNNTAQKNDTNKRQKIVYTVKQGDSLGKIAQKHGVKLAELKSWNTIKDDKKLKLGSKVTVYVDSNS
ncbi:transglycosylase SLT domain-containing protein [Thorsellia anophelis]|uniref:Membrane-bound lytic murein transglycosylase D n=1 Tax=Thorsellia anophelis DSM 18579 TaxID=1123402 RepID=A0A1H9YDJ1_9GAMM|nr:transglycosylase SLT domain-containing protein [Thorsellia anophelis]SES66951.1 membrane-bound lytic murein transglycosylase D [Thorsellia anophelis DSM 18579]